MEISQDTVTLIESLYEQLRSYEKVAGLLQLTPATVKKVIMKLQSKKSISQYNNKITDSEKFQIEAAFRYLQDTGERVTLNKIRQHSNLMHKSVGSIWDIMKSMNLGYPLKAKKETVQVRQMRQILSASPKEPQVKKEKDILNMSVDEVIENILEKDEILVKRQDIFRENEIDGKSFMLLDQECMSKDLGLKLGPILKIKHLQEEFASKRSSV